MFCSRLGFISSFFYFTLIWLVSVWLCMCQWLNEWVLCFEWDNNFSKLICTRNSALLLLSVLYFAMKCLVYRFVCSHFGQCNAYFVRVFVVVIDLCKTVLRFYPFFWHIWSSFCFISREIDSNFPFGLLIQISAHIFSAESGDCGQSLNKQWINFNFNFFAISCACVCVSLVKVFSTWKGFCFIFPSIRKECSRSLAFVTNIWIINNTETFSER